MATVQECFEMADAMVASGIHDLHSLKGLSSEDLQQRLRGVYSFGGLHIRRIQLFLQGVPFPLVLPLGTKRACPAPPQAHTVNTFYSLPRHHFASFISTGSCGRHHRIGSASSSYREHILFIFTPSFCLIYFNRPLRATSLWFHLHHLTLKITNRMKTIEILTLFTMQTRFLANARDRLMQSTQLCVM